MKPKDGITAPQGGSAQIAKLHIGLEATEATTTFYVNLAEVSLSTNDFCISFVRVPTKFSREKVEEAKGGKVITMEPDVQVVFAPTLMPLLIRSLITQKELYEKTFGVAIKDFGGANV